MDLTNEVIDKISEEVAEEAIGEAKLLAAILCLRELRQKKKFDFQF